MSQTLRLFIAVELPPEVQAVLRDVHTALEGRRLAVRWVDPAGTHLTLKFLGATPAGRVDAITQALEQVAVAHPPFLLSTGGLGVFPRPRAPRVVWLGVAGALAELRALQADVEQRVAPLGFPTEQRPFSPHLTLARTTRDASGADLAAIGTAVVETAAPASVGWHVGEMSLMQSDLTPRGARYTALARVGLGSDHNAPTP